MGKMEPESLHPDNKQSYLVTESFMLKPSQANSLSHQHTISYKAFDISYEQYLMTLDIFKKYSDCGDMTDRSLKKSFVPWKEVGELKFKNVHENHKEKERGKSIEMPFKKLTNNCRHTAIEIMEYVLEVTNIKGVKPYSIGNFSFPYKCIIKGNNLDQKSNFFVLPLPPNQKKITDKNIFNALKLIYSRLEGIPEKWEDKEDAVNKFDGLKKMYVEIIEKSIKNDSTFSIFDYIFEWESANKKIIGQHRRSGLFACGKTDTEKLFESIHRIHEGIKEEKVLSSKH